MAKKKPVHMTWPNSQECLECENFDPDYSENAEPCSGECVIGSKNNCDGHCKDKIDISN